MIIDSEERYYRMGPAEGYDGDVHPSDFVPPTELPLAGELDSAVFMSGSDGLHYGIGESSGGICGGIQTFAFAASSGELVACGWGYFGPLFVAPQAVLDSSPPPAFPVDPYWSDARRGCDGPFPLDALRQMSN